jgi:hypothetical protein
MFPVLANEVVATVYLAYSNVLASVYKNNTVLRLHTYGIRHRCGGKRSTLRILVEKPEEEGPF